MSANMWKPTQDTCEVCGDNIGREKAPTEWEGESPEYLTGCTIDDDHHSSITVCENCLSLFVHLQFEELEGLYNQNMES